MSSSASASTWGAILLGVGMFVVLFVPVLAGAVLLRRARRQRVMEASCGHCRYPVAATLGSSPRCPECGMLFSEVGVLVPRRRNRGLMLVACALILFPLMLCGLALGTSALAYRRAAMERAVMVRQQAALQQAAADARAALKKTAEQAAEKAEKTSDSMPAR